MNVDTERVIIEVQCRPVLWDMADEQYKDRDARQEAWFEICRQLFENFDKLSDAEKKEREKKIQTRWKTARDCYTKAKACNKKTKSGSSAKKGKIYSYNYYNMMTFLDSNSNHESHESLDQIEDENMSSGSAQPGTSSDQDSDFATSSTSKRTRKSKLPTRFEKELLKSINKRRFEDNDDDMSFFMSIMPTLKNFNTYQKLIFRTKVMEHLIEIEKSKHNTIKDLSSINALLHDETQD